MNESQNILVEIDRENWRYILYESNEGETYGDFIYSPQSFIDLSMLLKLNTYEVAYINKSRENKLKFADEIRSDSKKFIDKSLNRENFKLYNRPNYNIQTIELDKIISIDQLHKELQRVLRFPESYGKNWDAFWDCITGESKMPTNLIFYNYKTLSERFKEELQFLHKEIFKGRNVKWSNMF
jgi:RNAse (barnase) inhibitor barstar